MNHHHAVSPYNPDRFPIADLMPQSGSMILIDKITQIDDNSITTQVKVRDDGLFSFSNKTVPGWVGIEYMAQTIAAFSGYHCKLIGEPIRLGLLLGTRQFDSNHPHYQCETLLNIHAYKIIESANEMCVFDSTIEIAETNTTHSIESATAKINLLLPKDLDAFLAKNQTNNFKK